MTEELVAAAAANYESGLEAMSILIKDERLEKSDSERTLQQILKPFDLDTTRLFLQKRCSGTQVSENMLVAAAENPSHGAAITNLLLASGPKIPITGRTMMSAASNRGQGPEVMKIFLGSSQPIKTISPLLLSLAIKNWREGEEAMRMLLRDKRTMKIPSRVLDKATHNPYREEMIKAFFMETRSEFLRQVRFARPGHLAEKIAIFQTYGAGVMQLLLEMDNRNNHITPQLIDIVVGSMHGANLMRVLVRKRNTEVLGLLTPKMRFEAGFNWGVDVAGEVFAQRGNVELSWGIGISEDRFSDDEEDNEEEDEEDDEEEDDDDEEGSEPESSILSQRSLKNPMFLV